MTSNDFPTFRFRVLPYYDSAHKYFVAQCLETGSITTAEDSETVMEMMVELLEDEASYAVKHDNLGNLYSAPAPKDVWRVAIGRIYPFNESGFRRRFRGNSKQAVFCPTDWIAVQFICRGLQIYKRYGPRSRLKD